ncbi:putative heat shock protein 70 (HSP70)-interacting protein [Hibiscus syriacus]|uniref:Autophagy-related protein 9 n=1 Tax=Hibiscus syriacus TaxID=106335 RepID=A0A6A2WYI1_HIBSY|nr:putative heat shock protein 70 (HSP70)-interacting protein [Hibiscus syriacus]
MEEFRRVQVVTASPSGLLNGKPIADLNLFFERLYSFCCEKGLWCIIIKWIVELLSPSGHVCSFSAFDSQNHGNGNYGSPYKTPRALRSSQGKMEKSFLSFRFSYPSWEADAQGKQFLSNIRTFREQKLQIQGTRHAYSPDRLLQASPPRTYGDRNGFLSREMQHDILDTGRNFGSLWIIDAEQKNHPYILVWYYTTSRNRYANGYKRGGTAATEPSELGDQRYGDYWVPTNMTHNEARDEDYWQPHYDDRSRLQSHLELSTSASFFHGIPPDFNPNSSDRRYDNISKRSVEEEDQSLDLRASRRISRTTYMDDLEAGGDISLHFDYIYSRPPETPIITSINRKEWHANGFPLLD